MPVSTGERAERQSDPRQYQEPSSGSEALANAAAVLLAEAHG